MAQAQIITMGCRLNAFESEIMRRHAADAGLDEAVIVNTCAVTGEAVRQARQTIRRARRDNPDARIVVTGCAAQIEPQQFADMAEVDLVLGNEEKLKAESFAIPDFGIAAEERVRVDDIMSVRQTAPHMIDGFEGRARAFVQIQNGCDHRCTFCIIPFGRGNSRSVPAGAVIDQISRLVDGGCDEVVLTGVDITSYGQDLPGRMGIGALVAKVLHAVPDLARLRISSIDSIEVDEELLDVIGCERRLMPHLHLSVQAGDNLTLKRMKRRHSRDDTIAFCREARARRPDMVFGADIIAGFPTETEGMFENSLRLVDECDITFLHVFPYSARPGTPAARMPQVDGREIKARAARLREKGAVQLGRHLEGLRGRRLEVLMESARLGRTDQYAQVDVDGDQVPGSVVAVDITGVNGLRAVGRPAA
jgi:threonylcarbamoyladenosine tRNA methylthiotransferase MtaB